MLISTVPRSRIGRARRAREHPWPYPGLRYGGEGDRVRLAALSTASRVRWTSGRPPAPTRHPLASSAPNPSRSTSKNHTPDPRASGSFPQPTRAARVTPGQGPGGSTGAISRPGARAWRRQASPRSRHHRAASNVAQASIQQRSAGRAPKGADPLDFAPDGVLKGYSTSGGDPSRQTSLRTYRHGLRHRPGAPVRESPGMCPGLSRVRRAGPQSEAGHISTGNDAECPG